MSEKKMRFEQALEKLETVVAKLEAGNVPLDEALASYEEGMELIRVCNKQLDEAEQRVEAIRIKDDGFLTEKLD